jgi:hypothetical protein
MASGKPAQDPPALHTTRQMLDELDALMERMLALPVNDAEEAAPPPAQGADAPRSGTPPATTKSRPLAATLTLLQLPADEAPPVPGSAVPRSATPAKPLPPLPEVPAVAPAPLSNRVVPPAPRPSADELLADVPPPPTSHASWFILPLLWGNRLFDRGTLLLGETGAWLRGPAGRGALGTLGLILLAAAALWVMRDWLGWTW